MGAASVACLDMRNPDRIPVILSLLERSWIGTPDLRFGQLLGLARFLEPEMWLVPDHEVEARLREALGERAMQVPCPHCGKLFDYSAAHLTAEGCADCVQNDPRVRP